MFFRSLKPAASISLIACFSLILCIVFIGTNGSSALYSIKNNSQMIIKIAQRIDEVRDDLRKVSGKTDSFLEIGSEMDNLKNTINEIEDEINFFFF